MKFKTETSKPKIRIPETNKPNAPKKFSLEQKIAIAGLIIELVDLILGLIS